MKPKIVVGNEFEYNSHDAMSMKQCYTTQKTKMSQLPLFKDASLLFVVMNATSAEEGLYDES